MFGRYVFIYFNSAFPIGIHRLWLSLAPSVKIALREVPSLLWKRTIYIFFKIYLFWLGWVFVATRRLSPAVVSEGYSLDACMGFSLQWLLLL